MRKLIPIMLVCVSGLVLASFADAKQTPKPKTVKFSAALNIGQEVPHPKGTKAGAAGRFTATLTGTTLTWKLTFTHLSGPAAASHIHRGARHTSGPVLIALCGPCSSPSSGTATLTHDQITAMRAGKEYVNVHTAANPNGEIRGQITRAL